MPLSKMSSALRSRPKLVKRSLLGLTLAAGATLMVSWAATDFKTFVPNNQPTGWVTRPALSSNNLSSNNEVIYRPGYLAGTGAGVLEASYIDKDADITGSSPWTNANAAVTLDATDFDTGRKIVTLKSDGTKIPFRWSSLAAAQQTALVSEKVLKYVRGERANETPNGDKFRARKTVLGEILHSSLVHWNHGNGVKRLYVGANDGMLHVFNAGTGEELYAYIPSMLIPQLKNLTTIPYARNHFVDGPISIANVRTGTTTTATLLAGGLGAGGKGFYALDVTADTTTTAAISSETAAASRILWEIHSGTTGFANLGFTYATPRLARLNNDTPAVIIGNGYGNTGSGSAVLYVVNALDGTKIAEINTGAGDLTSPNGLSSPTLLDTNSDGKVDYAYAGDLDGNVWKFDLRSTTPSSFSATKLYTVDPADAITTAPAVQAHPNGGHMVLFGTGRTLFTADATDTSMHYVYGIWDGAPAGNTSLLAQSLTEVTSGGLRLRYASTNSPNWAATTSTAVGHRGWKLSLPAGARVVGENPFINDNRFYFTSTNPTIVSADDKMPDGENWTQQVNFLTGGGFAHSILDINNDGLVNDSDKVSGQVIIGGFLGAGVFSQPVLTDLKILSLTLFNSNPDLAAVPPGPDRGVSGGHFDFDIYYGTSTGASFANKKHVHEYDDKFDVTGVNMLAASEASFNLSNAITNADTQFKVLVMNQFLSPAATLSVGGKPFENVKTFGGMASATDATAMLAAQPVYSRKTLSTLVFNLPLDAFQSKDWWGAGGDGVLRAGLIPTKTGCVNKVSSTGVPETPGPNSERYNGALTIQIVRSTTPGSAMEINHSGGDIRFGWRLKSTEFAKYILAEYTAFWHHENGICYGQSGWKPNPEQDTSPPSTKTTTPAVGASDPKDGAFVLPSGETTTTGDSTSTGITEPSGGEVVRAAQEIRAGSGRINWREVTRE